MIWKNIVNLFAQKWDFEKQEYEDYTLPEGASCFEREMDVEVACCQCGKLQEYGNCFTSLEIHTQGGFGYAVCSDCYSQEWERRRKYDD